MRYALLGTAIVACTLTFAADVPRIAFIKMPPPGKHVDLDDEAKLESIRRDDPARYGRIAEAIEAAQVTSCDELPHMLKTRLNIFDTHCSPYTLLTSFPPKSRVTFQIDDTEYSLNVVQNKLAPSKMMPALHTK